MSQDIKSFPWLANYPEGVPHEVNVRAYESVRDMFETASKEFANLPAFENMGKVYTYREVDELSRNFAAYLQHLGMKKGDRIAIQMPNILQYPVVLFGAIRAGLIIANTNPLYTAREMEHQFKDSGVTAVVILANFAFNLEKVIKNTSIKHVFVTEVGDLIGGLKGPFINFMLKQVKKKVPAYNIPQAVKLVDALKKGKSMNFERPEISYDDIGFLQYTGGTTGVSKGATLTQGNIVANTQQFLSWSIDNITSAQEIVITALPLYHIFAFTVNCMGMYIRGSKNILITNPRDMAGFLKEISRHPFTVITGVNTLYNSMMNHPDFEKVDFSHLKMAVGGGMAVQKPVNERWKKLTGLPIIEGYGLSETSPVLTTNPVDGNERIGWIGMPVPNTEVRIMDDSGNEMPVGEPGEICARGPQVMRGYWNREEETQKVFHEGGWFRTGDIGIMGEDGFFRIVDRKKDMILVSGFNVYPNEIEDVIAGNDKVSEVAAIGIPDPKSTEAVKVFIVRKDDSLTKEELVSYCREHMTGYKVPKHVEFREELPKSNVGKILRRKLRE